MSIQAKVLVLDIETAPILAYVWDLWDQNIGLNQIHTDRYIMAWSAKWLGEKEVMYFDKRGLPPGDDKGILLKLRDLLDEADIVITQNGEKFDSKRINARLIEHRIKPPKPYRHFDTYKLVKSVADFPSNKLEYLTQKLNRKYTKSYHRKYPGFSLWANCLKGKVTAWNEMKRYNILDVLATEELYYKLRPWAPNTFPDVYPLTDKSSHCGTCGFFGKMREGRAKINKYTRYTQRSCLKCGAWQKGERIK